MLCFNLMDIQILYIQISQLLSTSPFFTQKKKKKILPSIFQAKQMEKIKKKRPLLFFDYYRGSSFSFAYNQQRQ